jgi:hypothetical protein
MYPVIHAKIHPTPPAEIKANTLTPCRTTPRRQPRQISKSR